jgi:hypothetical protein
MSGDAFALEAETNPNRKLAEARGDLAGVRAAGARGSYRRGLANGNRQRSDKGHVWKLRAQVL